MLQTLEELLKYADQLERKAGEAAAREAAAPVVVSRLGSPTRHPPVTFTTKGECMWCRGKIWTGCGHAACGHMHTGDCWAKCHSSDPKIRAKLKRKRMQPEIAHGESAGARRVRPRPGMPRPRQPRFEEAEGEEEGEESEEGEEEGDEGEEGEEGA